MLDVTFEFKLSALVVPNSDFALAENKLYETFKIILSFFKAECIEFYCASGATVENDYMLYPCLIKFATKEFREFNTCFEIIRTVQKMEVVASSSLY